MLNALLERKHKVLIFSQMTRMLDIIQDFCNLRVRYILTSVETRVAQVFLGTIRGTVFQITTK
jgi:SNF2 family DNA or RNA helicase